MAWGKFSVDCKYQLCYFSLVVVHLLSFAADLTCQTFHLKSFRKLFLVAVNLLPALQICFCLFFVYLTGLESLILELVFLHRRSVRLLRSMQHLLLDADLQLLGEAERSRQLHKQKKRRRQGHEDEVLNRMAGLDRKS
ncbi:uncharacterized protein LOC130988965 isoform X2 [Salvia miltiorrhiza]|uniref:uncharacterized protein LOC130988965 isoform X2 n=1 Tax=Salvia miltiorrhiza TaxID=226208 RepID=UPI0025AC5322|nr:uncharacterized protein LOC130988965 isoform X2 [Salvia miltiorrhiza]